MIIARAQVYRDPSPVGETGRIARVSQKVRERKLSALRLNQVPVAESAAVENSTVGWGNSEPWASVDGSGTLLEASGEEVSNRRVGIEREFGFVGVDAIGPGKYLNGRLRDWTR